MNRKELDKKILEAITALKSERKRLTVINIQEVTGLRLYQIYNSKHKGLLEVRGSKRNVSEAIEVAPDLNASQATEIDPTPTQVEDKKADIDLFYKLFGSTLTIELKEAIPDSIDDAIEDLAFLFKKSIARLQREKSNLY